MSKDQWIAEVEQIEEMACEEAFDEVEFISAYVAMGFTYEEAVERWEELKA